VACVTNTGEQEKASPDPTKRHFVVKIQRLVNDQSMLSINNEEMTISGRLLPMRNPTLSPVLEWKIMSEGFYGTTAFFHAIWDSKRGLKVNPHVVLPLEVW
jgi:hypothetical protein